MITTYLPKDLVDYNTKYEYRFGNSVGGWVPATVKVVHHEDDGNGVPFTYVDIELYNFQPRRLYEPAMKLCLRPYKL